MIELRLDRRLAARVDTSQILHDAFADAAKRIGELSDVRDTLLFLWFRKVVGDRLDVVHRQGLGTMSVPASMELSLFREVLPTTSSAALAAQLLGRQTSPKEAAVRAARILRLQEALNAMDRLDREVLSLRHFERLTVSETAKELGIEESVASRRYIVALKRLKEILASS
jgi:RNA polymerase sigma-70 factor (ECF subfamily)